MYCVHLDFPDLLGSSICDLPQSENLNYWRITEFSKEFLEFFHSLDLTVTAEVFYTPPGMKTGVHADGIGDIIKLNWCIGGRGSEMLWWKPRFRRPLTKTQWPTPTIRYSDREVTELHREKIGKPSMVQVGIPHNVDNPYEPRWCISVIPLTKNTAQRLQWQQGLDLFRPWIKAVEH